MAAKREVAVKSDTTTENILCEWRDTGKIDVNVFLLGLDLAPSPSKVEYLYISDYVFQRRKISEEKKLANDAKELDELIDKLELGCGINEHLTPDMDEKEHVRILALLDTDKEKFAGILKTGLLKLKDSGSKELFTRFARLTYYNNGYQAPPRLTVEEATKDSMGLSDHFQELLDSTKKEIKSEEKKKG